MIFISDKYMIYCVQQKKTFFDLNQSSIMEYIPLPLRWTSQPFRSHPSGSPSSTQQIRHHPSGNTESTSSNPVNRQSSPA